MLTCCFSSMHPEGVPTGPPMPLDDDDVAYVRREFGPRVDARAREGVSLAEVRDRMHGEQLPDAPGQPAPIDVPARSG
jgi:hypothetical protein